MKRLRPVTLIVCLVIGVAVLSNPLTSKAATENRPQLSILYVEADLDSETVLIQGENFVHTNSPSTFRQEKATALLLLLVPQAERKKYLL